MPTVKLSELELAFDFMSFSSPFTHSAYISHKTGEIIWELDLLDEEEELPEDLGDPEHYIEVPDKSELDPGERPVLRFVATELRQEYGHVEEIFRRKGAYSRYMALLERKEQLEAWFRYEEDETRAALRQWCAEEGIELIEGKD
jgi:hypothetical protein